MWRKRWYSISPMLIYVEVKLKWAKMAVVTGKKRPSGVSLEALAAEADGSPKGITKSPKKNKPLPEKKFGGMTEEEVCKLLLPDHMKAGLDIIFVSIACFQSNMKCHCYFQNVAIDWHQSWSIFCLFGASLLQCEQPFLWVHRSPRYLINSLLIMFGIGPCLFESGLIPKKLTFREDAQLLNYGIGITNIVPRTTRAANELSRLVVHYPF